MNEPQTSLSTWPVPTWDEIAADGGIDKWIDARLRERELIDETTDPSSLSSSALNRFKNRRDAERAARRKLKKLAWQAYKRVHLVHLGYDVFYHDIADIDRYDHPDPESQRERNALPDIQTAQELANILEISPAQLRWLTFQRDVDSGCHYHIWTIPKRDGSQRLISAPKPQLKRIQRWVLREIVEHLPVHGAAHGFLPGRSTLSNARTHLNGGGQQLIIKLDIKDFYPSIHWRRVKGLFRKAGYGEQVATLLALLCTDSPREMIEIDGKTQFVAAGPRALPQGAPTSPALTNALCLRLDCRLTGLAKQHTATYTRYADDLTFSLANDPKTNIGPLLHHIQQIVTGEGFTLHPDKRQILRPGRRQAITGLVVNNSAEAANVRVPRDFIRRLRAALHNRRNGRGGAESLTQIRGWIAYLHMIDPHKAVPFWSQLKTLEAAADE